MTPVRRSLAPILLAAAVVLVGCGSENQFDAQGNFEAEEVTVSSEMQGQLIRFSVEEGDRLPGGLGAPPSSDTASTDRAVVGLVDTTRLDLQRRELRARRRSARSKISSVTAEVEVLMEKLRAARRELQRARTLREGDAAPEREVDRAEDEVRVLERRVEATRAQKASLADEIEAVNEQIAQANERIRKSRIKNPIAGTVLETYAEEGEIVRAGEPLYNIAALDTLTLRAYVSGAQLTDVKIGREARILIDDGPDAQRALPGRVTWVADEAEFTPTPIQTHEERVEFVYAVKLRVPNFDGVLKIGMPADVVFRDSVATGTTSDMSEHTTTAKR